MATGEAAGHRQYLMKGFSPLQEGEAEVTCDRGSGKLTSTCCALIKAGEK